MSPAAMLCSPAALLCTCAVHMCCAHVPSSFALLPRLHYRLLTLCPAPTDPVDQSWPRGTESVGRGAHCQ